MIVKNSVLKLVNKQLRTCVVFNFHDIVDEDKPVRSDQLSLSSFRSQLCWIQKHFSIVRIDELIDHFQAGTVTKPTAALTFDDGYKSHFKLIKPILDEFQIKAAFYVSSAHLNNDYYWHDLVETYCQHTTASQQKMLEQEVALLTSQSSRSLIESIKYLPLTKRANVLSIIEESTKQLITKDLLMNSSEVLELSNEGHLIGGHTLNHPILALESEQICVHEIIDDLLALEKLLNRKITTFAYPNGIPDRDFNMSHQEILASYGVKYAVNTDKSVLKKDLNPLSIPRVNLYGSNESLHCNYLLRIITNSLFN